MIDTLERLAEVFRLPPARVAGLFSEWFVSYHADLFVHGVPFEIYIRKARAILDALGSAPRILDVGAGFGVYACLLRILGAKEVVALDYHREKTIGIRKLVSYLELDGVRCLQGDATALPFAPESFDGALALASLSHIRDASRALASIHRVLRREARLYVFEDNNSSYPGYAAQMSKVWAGAESGTYADDVPGEKKISIPYAEIRRKLILDAFPDIGLEALERAVRATRGLYGRPILEAVDELRRNAGWTHPRIHLVCHPVSGEFEEYPLNPAIVRDLLDRAGFDAVLRSPHTGPFRGRARWLKEMVAAMFRLCPGLLPLASPTFAVVGTRRNGDA